MVGDGNTNKSQLKHYLATRRYEGYSKSFANAWLP